jgi:hypothetical protein
MVTAYQGLVEGGRIRLDEGQTLPDGARVIVVVVRDDDLSDRQGISGAEILASDLVGLWAGREDITDSAAYAEDLRRRAERRGDE